LTGEKNGACGYGEGLIYLKKYSRRLPGLFYDGQRVMPNNLSEIHPPPIAPIKPPMHGILATKPILITSKPVDTAKGLFTSKNILGDCLAYFMMVSVLYGLLTW
jgi:hypothetical protein